MMTAIDIKKEEVQNHHWTQLDNVVKGLLNLEHHEVDALVDHLSKTEAETFLSFLEAPRATWRLLSKRAEFVKLIKYYQVHEEELIE